MPLIGTTDAPGLLLRIRSDSSDAIKDIGIVSTAIKGLAGNIGSSMPPAVQQIATLGQGLTALSGPLGIAAGATTALVAGIAAVGLASLAAAKHTAEYGDTIFDMAQKTGVGTDELQGFKVAADQSGSSLESIQNQLTKFTVLLGKAQSGNDEARKTLEKYGITTLDVNKALEQAITRIGNLSTAEDQNAAAAELFKDRGGNVINMLREMDFNLKGSITRLKDMGILMSEDDVAAAGDFADSLDDLNKQLDGIVRMIGTEVIPTFAKLFKDISGWLTDNKGEIKAWAEYLASTMSKTILQMKQEWNDLSNLIDLITAKSASQKIYGALQQPGDPLQNVANAGAEASRRRLLESERLARLQLGQRDVPGAAAPVPSYARPTDFKKDPRDQKTIDEDIKKAKEKAAKERLETDIKNAKASVDLLKTQLSEQDRLYKLYYDRLAEMVAKGDATKAQADTSAKAYESAYAGEREKNLTKLEAGQKKLADLEKKTGAENEARRAEERADRLKDNQSRQEAIDKYNKSTTEAEKKAYREQAERAKDIADDRIAIYENATRIAIANSEKQLAEEKKNETEHLRFVQLAEENLLSFKIKKLTEAQAVAREGSEEEGRLAREISALQTELREKQIQGETELFLLRKRNLQELLDLQLDVLKAERDILDARADQQRLELNKKVDKAVGAPARRKALEELRDFEVQEAIRRYNETYDDLAREEEAALKRIKGKENEEEQKLEIEKLYRERRLLGEEEFRRRLKEINEGYDEESDPFKQLKDSWDEFKDSVINSADMDASLASIGGSLLEMLNNMQDALKSSIANWILYGDSMSVALRKALAAQLATFAAEAAINALRATALGFYLLAMQQYHLAGQAFTSAALWAAVAIGAGVAARIINPKSATATSGGSAGGGGGGGTREENVVPLSRMTETAGDSGNRLVAVVRAALDRHAAATEALNQKIGSMPPHDIITKAEDQSPGIVTEMSLRGVEGNGSFATRFQRVTGTGR